MVANPEEKKKRRGCISPTDWKVFEVKCVCHDEQPGCVLCFDRYWDRSTGIYQSYRCPVAMIKDSNAMNLINYYYLYQISNYQLWPNGRTRYYQPKPLTMAFDYFAWALQPKKEGNDG